MDHHRLKSRKKWGIILLVWPPVALVVAFILFAVVNWFNNATTSQSMLFDDASPVATVANVLLFILGAFSVALGLPSMIVGLVLLFGSGTPPIQHAPAHVSPAAAPVSASNTSNSFAVTGMVLGITSVILFWILGFVLGVLAIIFSSLALKRTNGKGMAIAGLVTGIIGTLLSLCVGIGIIIGSLSATQEQASNTAIETNARIVQQRAEAFSADNDAYPSLDEIRTEVDSAGDAIIVGEQGDDTSEDVIYIPCYGRGAIIWYWDASIEEYREIDLGETDSCEWN